MPDCSARNISDMTTIFKNVLAFKHCVQEVSEDKLEVAFDLCEYKDDARGMVKTHNTSFHKYMFCICNHCDYETEKGFLM